MLTPRTSFAFVVLLLLLFPAHGFLVPRYVPRPNLVQASQTWRCRLTCKRTSMSCAWEERQYEPKSPNADPQGVHNIECRGSEDHLDIQHEAGRRRILFNCLSWALACTSATQAEAKGKLVASFPTRGENVLVLPLKEYGGSYCVQYLIDNRGPFRAVVDTGSPFLTVAGSCTERWGCFQAWLHGTPTLYSDTVEVYAAKEGPVTWRQGLISFVNATDEAGQEWRATDYALWQRAANKAQIAFRVRGQVGNTPLVFGVLSDSLVARPGGVFLGLIKERERDIRPTFLGQTDFVAWSMDLASRSKTLRLSRAPLLADRPPQDLIKLTDLRVFGDPVQHYASEAVEVRSNGATVDLQGSKVYVIFDTGTTGLTVTRDLYDRVMEGYRLKLMEGMANRKLARRAKLAAQQAPGATPDVSEPSTRRPAEGQAEEERAQQEQQRLLGDRLARRAWLAAQQAPSAIPGTSPEAQQQAQAQARAQGQEQTQPQEQRGLRSAASSAGANGFKRSAQRPWREAEVSFETGGKTVTLSAIDPIVTPVDLPWGGFHDHLLVVGLSFLEGSVVTVDLSSGVLAVDSM
jgi:hypothetical protein